jgi:hypothetical protein
MACRPTTGGAGGGPARLSPAGFEQALREATASILGHAFGPRTVLIPDLRRALDARITREEFDRGLRRLRQEGSIDLVRHGHPEFLRLQEVQDALPEGEEVLYLLRWLK